MRRTSILVAWAVAGWIATPAVEARPPHPPGRDPHPKPPATVVARVNVNVDTDVDVAAGPGGEEEEREEEGDSGEKGSTKPDLAELVGALLKQSGSGSGVLVIADINVNVETSIKVRSHASKVAPSGQKSAAAGKEGEAKAAASKPEADANTPPRKKRAGKRGKKPAEVSGRTPSVSPPTVNPGITLNQLKIGDRLEIGVSRQFDSEQRARQLADQINSRKSQSLLGMALAGVYLPDQAESLRVVQQAIASVNAKASGGELSISAAIPKETPTAIRTLVEAAIRR